MACAVAAIYSVWSTGTTFRHEIAAAPAPCYTAFFSLIPLKYDICRIKCEAPGVYSVVSGKHARLTSVGSVLAERTWQESELETIAMRYVFFSLEPCLRVRFGQQCQLER